MKRVTIEVTQEVHKRLKAKTAIEGVTITRLLNEFINNYLNNFNDGNQKG